MKAITLLMVAILFCPQAKAQRPPFFYHNSHDEWYLKQAAELLPEYYRKAQFDSIQLYINATANTTRHPYVFATRLLLKMQADSFNISMFKTRYFIDSLQQYAYMVRLSQSVTPPIGEQPGTRLQDMPYEDRLYLFDAVWAKLLIAANRLDSTETFLCRVIAGQVESPADSIHQHRYNYPELDSMLASRSLLRRSSFAGNLAIGAGVWAPQGNASRLGVHPSIDMLLGVRNKLNQVDLTINLRFGRTPHDYVVLRSDSLYSRHYYLGGYVGADYTRYLYHSLHFEAGVTAGIGYDSYDIAIDGSDNGDYTNDYLKPLEIGSLNLNTGVRMNIFYTERAYIGLHGKFNYIRYNNKGGTPMDGNAFSLSLVFGHN
ncbi:MAG TPA: hypothetical protein VHB48_00990 [Chitinophagaceae bacterium]|nr:hypothetical protein [Chitinophagaceae bacterium]